VDKNETEEGEEEEKGVISARWWADFFIRWITQELDVVCSF
jgi:hypothetical protein